jgi:glycosyltransferase involved in cell wall biosynthesis
VSVSYLITLYNKEDCIGPVVDAVLAEREETGGEVIIYDDASTDHSPEIVKQHIEGKPARLIRGEKNRGVCFATNFLIDLATQPYTRLVDGDDVLIKGSTAQMLRHLKERGLGFIHGMTTEIGNEPPGLDRQAFAECFLIDNPVRVVLRHAIAGASPSLFVTDVLKRAAPVPNTLRRGQDFLITLRVANAGARMGYVKDIVSIGPSHRTENNLSASLAAMFAEMSRGVAHDGPVLPLDDLRFASRRYAGRTAKYFRRRGQSKLSAREKFDLWRWRNFGWLASRQACIDRINRTADFLDRDRDVMITGPSRPHAA